MKTYSKPSLKIMHILNTYGGEGSGNFDHAGIPGHLGGSASGGSDVLVYHGTAEEVTDDILKNGLILQSNGTKDIWGTSSKEKALEYAYDRAKKEAKEMAVIVLSNTEKAGMIPIKEGSPIFVSSSNISKNYIHSIEFYSAEEVRNAVSENKLNSLKPVRIINNESSSKKCYIPILLINKKK